MSATAVTSAPGSLARLGGERFEVGPIALAWSYRGIAGERAHAVVHLPCGEVTLLAERIYRLLGADAGAVRALRTQLLRLETPGDPCCDRLGDHELMLVRPWMIVNERSGAGAQPILLDPGDRRTFLAFDDVDNARAFARRVHGRGHKPSWRSYPAESWRSNPTRQRPRLALSHCGTHERTLEGVIEDILARERRLLVRRARRGL